MKTIEVMVRALTRRNFVSLDVGDHAGGSW